MQQQFLYRYDVMGCIIRHYMENLHGNRHGLCFHVTWKIYMETGMVCAFMLAWAEKPGNEATFMFKFT